MIQPTIVAAVWLCTRGGRVLAVRPRGGSPYFLPGGLPEPGETLAEAAAREVLEEVAVVVDADALVEVVRVKDDAYGRPGVRVELVCFAGVGVGEPTAQPPEITEIAWLGRHEWSEFAPPVRKVLHTLWGD